MGPFMTGLVIFIEVYYEYCAICSKTFGFSENLFLVKISNKGILLDIISYPLFVPRIRKGTHLKESVFPSAFGFREYGFLKVCAFCILGTNNG